MSYISIVVFGLLIVGSIRSGESQPVVDDPSTVLTMNVGIAIRLSHAAPTNILFNQQVVDAANFWKRTYVDVLGPFNMSGRQVTFNINVVDPGNSSNIGAAFGLLQSGRADIFLSSIAPTETYQQYFAVCEPNRVPMMAMLNIPQIQQTAKYFYAPSPSVASYVESIVLQGLVVGAQTIATIYLSEPRQQFSSQCSTDALASAAASGSLTPLAALTFFGKANQTIADELVKQMYLSNPDILLFCVSSAADLQFFIQSLKDINWMPKMVATVASSSFLGLNPEDIQYIISPTDWSVGMHLEGVPIWDTPTSFSRQF